MTKNYVLIDLENTQPENLELLADGRFKVIVFLGAKQAKISSKLAMAMQNLGSEGQYIEMAGNGPNALDFHIAYYLGKLATADPQGHYFIVSGDKGFDPLIKHIMNSRDGGLKVQRVGNLVSIPGLRSRKKQIKPQQRKGTANGEDRIGAIVRNLTARGSHRPRTVKTLRNCIGALFGKQIPESELQKLVDELRKRKFIQITDQRITYSLLQDPLRPFEAPLAAASPNEQLLLEDCAH